jgi:hypothetical protein
VKRPGEPRSSIEPIAEDHGNTIGRCRRST